MTIQTEALTYERRERVEGFRYQGSFDLTFLRGGESVRMGSSGCCIIELEKPIGCTSFQVPIGDWIVREPDGALSRVSHSEFQKLYSRAPVELVPEGMDPTDMKPGSLIRVPRL